MIAPARADDLSSHVLYERPDGLWGRYDGDNTQLCDRGHYERIDLNGSPCYVLLRYDQQRTWIKVLQCESSGAVCHVYTITGQPLREATAIETIDHIGPHQLAICLHVSPRETLRVTFDLSSGTKTIRRTQTQ